MGWSMIAAICLNMVVNGAFILICATKQSFINLRRLYYECRLKKLRRKADKASLVLALELDLENYIESVNTPVQR